MIARAALPLVLVVALAPAGADAARSSKAAVSLGARPLKLGMRGKDVRVLQRALTTLGLSTAVDGVYGKATSKNVMKLERLERWRIDGKISKKDAARIAALAGRGGSATAYYLYGPSAPSLTLTAQQAGNARVDVIDGASNVVASIPMSFPSAGTQSASWNGLGDSGYVADGTYQLKLGNPGGAGAVVTSGQTQPFGLYARAFPVFGAHSFGGVASRFGAPRGTHTHQGQDVSAACGTQLVLAEGGTVRVDSYQASGAGYYVVVHGALSGTDYVYMHMKKPSWAVVGQTVYTGQQIGKVGNTGSSNGCHLHFEHWTYPGWYLGGYPYDPLAELQAWDAYS
jgi:murein DD-endopeptidase MepM/ murein hydrolase activator NlpD